jgi:hypothetical protein
MEGKHGWCWPVKAAAVLASVVAAAVGKGKTAADVVVATKQNIRK